MIRESTGRSVYSKQNVREETQSGVSDEATNHTMTKIKPNDDFGCAQPIKDPGFLNSLSDVERLPGDTECHHVDFESPGVSDVPHSSHGTLSYGLGPERRKV